MKTIDAAKGRWAEIFEHYGLPPITGKNHFKGECPVCGRRGKYRCDDHQGMGSWICTCGSGDGMKLLSLTVGKPFNLICAELDQMLGNDYRHIPVPQNSSAIKSRQRVISKFAKLVDLRGTSGAGYFHRRGINQFPVEAVRFCDRQRHAGAVYQALYALATDNKGELCYLHQTLLNGERKAAIGDSAKRLKSLQEPAYLEHAQSVAIRMFPVSSTLGIAEGIETALACHQIYQCNVWATLNSGFMKKFRVPAGVKRLCIFADTDSHTATGHAAAFECAHKNLNAKNDLEQVTVFWPESGDFNDMLINGSRAFRWDFYKSEQERAA